MNNNVCLNLMMIESDIKKLLNKEENYLNFFINNLKVFEYKFYNLFIVIDSANKNEDPVKYDFSFLINELINKDIIDNSTEIKIDYLNWKTEFSKLEKIIFEIFNTRDIDIKKTYKNAFGYYYSFYNCPSKYMFHIDIPKKGRVCYKKNDNIISHKFILKSLELLKKEENIDFICCSTERDAIVKLPYNKNNEILNKEVKLFNNDGSLNNNGIDILNNSYNYQIYFDNKPNLSLQCYTTDIDKIKSQWFWNKNLYRFQTENALTNMRKMKTITLLPHNTSPIKTNI